MRAVEWRGAGEGGGVRGGGAREPVRVIRKGRGHGRKLPLFHGTGRRQGSSGCGSGCDSGGDVLDITVAVECGLGWRVM